MAAVENGKRTAIDDERYFDMIFRGYQNKYTSDPRPKVDHSVVSAVKCGAKAAYEQMKEKEPTLKQPTPIQDGYTLTQESWEECLDYYEVELERLMFKNRIRMADLVALERWFLPLIEPLPSTKRERKMWKQREEFKIQKYHSIYLPSQLSNHVSDAMMKILGNTFAISHSRTIRLLMLSPIAYESDVSDDE